MSGRNIVMERGCRIFEPINKDEHSTSWSWLGSGFVEGNSWQYTWMVPHDMNELVKMIGREEFNRRLNEGFEISSEYSFSPPGDSSVRLM